MQSGDVQVARRDERRPSRRGILLGLLPLTLLAAALVAAPAQADPQFDAGCRVQLTGEPPGPLGPSNTAELTFECTQFNVEKVLIEGSGDKDFLVFPLAPGGAGAFVCVPGGTSSATCETAPGGQSTATFTILAQDVCGTEDNVPLVVAVTLTGPAGEPTPEAVFKELPIQCEEPAQPPTTTPTTPPSASAPASPGGGGGTQGVSGVSGAEDNGQVPLGGVQSGAGGGAPGDDDGGGLLAAVVGLMLAATLGLGIARARTVKG
jgi:hypothetical protein